MMRAKKISTSLEAGTFTMSERLWAGLEKVAANRVYEDFSRPNARSMGTMVGLSKAVVVPLVNMGLVKATGYRRGDFEFQDYTTTQLGRQVLATRGIEYPVRYPEIGDVDPCPRYSLAAYEIRARSHADNEG